MPVYQFEALDAQGSTRKGTLEADTARAARNQLRSQQLVPLAVEPLHAAADAPESASRALWRSRAFDSTTLAVWTRQLAGLVAAGLPVERALSALADEAETPRQQHIVSALRAEVNAGSSLSAAMQLHPHEFSSIYTAVIAAGEHSGALAQVLTRLADDLEQQQELRGKLASAATYPAIVTLVTVLIVIFLLTYVVPQVASVFTSSRRALPLLTVLMLAFSAWVRQWWWLILLLGTGGTVLLVQARARSDAFRQRLDTWLLRLPLFGRMSQHYNAARFGSTLALLVQAGVPILRALQAATATLSNRAMQIDAEDALVLVREGAPLASALAQKKRFPALLAMFARLGEQTGQLPTMLDRAAWQLGGQVQRRANRLAAMLSPLLTLGMGLMVLLIVLAVLMPIIQLNQMVG